MFWFWTFLLRNLFIKPLNHISLYLEWKQALKFLDKNISQTKPESSLRTLWLIQPQSIKWSQSVNILPTYLLPFLIFEDHILPTLCIWSTHYYMYKYKNLQRLLKMVCTTQASISRRLLEKNDSISCCFYPSTIFVRDAKQSKNWGGKNLSCFVGIGLTSGISVDIVLYILCANYNGWTIIIQPLYR